MIGYCPKHGVWSDADACPLCDPSPAPEQSAWLGAVDLAKLHDYSAMVDGPVSQHKALVKSVKIWPHVDYTVIVREASERYRRKSMPMLGIDATGVGEPISEMFAARGVRTQDIKFGEYVDYTNPWGDKEKAPIKYAMFEYARACLQAGFVKFSKGTEELVTQLKEQEMVVGVTDKPTYRHPSGRHDDAAMAFLIWLYISRPYLTGNATFWFGAGDSALRRRAGPSWMPAKG